MNGGGEMNKSKLLITALLVLIPNLIRCENGVVKYQDDFLHFTFNAPNGWERIDKKAFDEFIKVRRNEANQAIRFDAAFQRISDKWFDFPYFLIQIHNGTGSLDKLLEAIKKEQMPGGGSRIDARIDKNKNCIIAKTFFLGDQEKIKQQAVMVMFPGKDNMIQLNCYSDQMDRDESDINFIINSFSFSDGYGYPSPITRFLKNININWEKGIAAGIIAFFSVWYAQVKRKKKKPYSPLAHEESQNNQKTGRISNENEKGVNLRFYKVIVAIFLFLICIYMNPLKDSQFKVGSIETFVINNFAYGFGFFVIYFLMGAAITLNRFLKAIPLKLLGLQKPGDKIEDIKPVSFIKSVSKMEDFISACFYANIIQLVLLLIPSK